MAAVRALAGVRLGDGFTRTLLEAIGGPAGCSHIVTLAFFLDGAVRAVLARDREAFPARWLPGAPGGMVARRDLVFDAHELDDGRVEVGLRFGDLHWNCAPPTALAPDRFWRHGELRAIAPSSHATRSSAVRPESARACNVAWITAISIAAPMPLPATSASTIPT